MKIGNKKTVALTESQFYELIDTMATGSSFFRPNEQVMTALIMEANLGIRISDILRMRLNNFVMDGGKWKLNITEQKTQKKRYFTVPYPVYQHIENYCLRKGIKKDEQIFKIGVRQVQKYLAKVVEFLGYGENISTHSFRKFFITEIFKENGHDLVMCQRILQHSSVAVTQRYIGIYDKQIEEALEKNIHLMG